MVKLVMVDVDGTITESMLLSKSEAEALKEKLKS